VSPAFLHGYACAVLQGLVDDLAGIVRHLRSLAHAFERETEPHNEKGRFLLVCSSRDAHRRIEGVTSAVYIKRLPRLRHSIGNANGELNTTLQHAEQVVDRLLRSQAALRDRWHGLGTLHDGLGPSLTPHEQTQVTSFFLDSQDIISTEANALDRAAESLREYVYKCVGGDFGSEGPTT
jgi:hypothetical protein